MGFTMHWIINRLNSFADAQALIFGDRVTTYSELHNSVQSWIRYFEQRELPSGAVVSIEGNCSPTSCALMLALVNNGNIVVPICGAPESKLNDFLDIAQVQYRLQPHGEEEWYLEATGRVADHDFYAQLRAASHAGLVLFSSGTTGKPKASVLDFHKLLEKHQTIRLARRTLAFLSLDHIGGINTLLHTISQGGALITVTERTPDIVFAAIQRWQVQVLPTTPTFLNMMLISNVATQYDLSALNLITYGTEPMPPVTLRKLSELLPQVQLKQTYGLSEVGILPTKSRSNSDLWVKLGNAGFSHKIIDNILWIKSDTAMLGYLNAHSPFDEEGYFNTQDVVEVDGDYVKILGRRSEIINVGGEKVYPNEVEDVILQAGNVADVTVMGAPSPVMGMVVKAIIRPAAAEDHGAQKLRIMNHCKTHLEGFKVPMLIEISDNAHHSTRFKKMRAAL
jgi:acyl-CoA synthetase (AMP-forming)/AMP-acid ligase II